MSYRLTLAEAESYLRKAARACGLDWGLAEEAGKAARWLAAFDLPGPELMLAHLQNLRDKDYRDCMPDCRLEPWQASGGLLCPIVGGAALADRAALMIAGSRFCLGRSAYPLLLAATLSQAAYHYRKTFTVEWDGARIDCFADGIGIEGARDRLLLPVVERVDCRQQESALPRRQPSTLAYTIDEAVFAQIDALAFETYAPASEESRAGAGAGLSDND